MQQYIPNETPHELCNFMSLTLYNIDHEVGSMRTVEGKERKLCQIRQCGKTNPVDLVGTGFAKTCILAGQNAGKAFALRGETLTRAHRSA